MKKIAYLQLADLVLAFTSISLPLDIRWRLEYEKFVSSEQPKNIDIACTVEVRNFSVSSDMHEIKTYAANTWKLYQNATEKMIVLQGEDLTAPPRCVLHFPHDCSVFGIYYSDANVLCSGGQEYIELFPRPLDQLILMHYLLRTPGVLLHASAVVIDGKGYVFPGVSGSGKSTIAKTCMNNGITSWLTDERVVLRRNGDVLMIYGTPWASSAGVAVNAGVQLGGVFFIRHGDEPKIRKLTGAESTAKLLPVTSIQWYDDIYTQMSLDFVANVIERIPMFEFSYKPEARGVDALHEFICEQL